MLAVRADLAAAGLTHCTSSSTSSTCYLLWVAAWDGNAGIPAGYDGHQWFGGNVIDKDTWASYWFKAAPPPLPLCQRTECYSRYPDVTVFTRVGQPCHHGCSTRQVVSEYDSLRAHPASHPALLKTYAARAAALTARFEYLDGHRTAAQNKKFNTQALRNQTWHRGVQHKECQTWAACVR
jgi:hypothetical protein